jgi:D-arabinose 1-dehydrogenase-like Zn-dependent alcohol dehydrogenase
MSKMRAMFVPAPGGPFRLEERDLPEPGRHEVRIRVHACGVCHSDSFIVEGHMPGLSYPRIPGHEVIGVIDALGPDVEGWDVQAMGGAKAIIATVTSAEAMQAISGGLGVNGTMMVIGAVGALTVNSLDLLGKRASVRGWIAGTAADSEDTLLFCQLNGIASMNEIFPLEEAQAAYDRMMSGKARFRVVLKIDS